MKEKVLVLEDLSASFFTERGEVKAADRVSLECRAGEITGLVGESGCGKSMTARAIMDLIRSPGRVTGGKILLEGRDLTKMTGKERRSLMGSAVSMIFQEPMTSLNPVMTIGKQAAEALRLHEKVGRSEARERVIAMLEATGIPDPEKRYDCYPHQLSGGMRQRAMIAMAMICKPRLLIADEPTTALDVTVEAQILELMQALCRDGTGILLITHNLGVVARVCDRVYVMYAGRVMEEAETLELFDHPAHPYTRGLLEAVRSLDEGRERLATIPGTVPELTDLPTGCSFRDRCGEQTAACGEAEPEWREIAPGHRVRCCRGKN